MQAGCQAEAHPIERLQPLRELIQLVELRMCGLHAHTGSFGTVHTDRRDETREK